MLQRYKKYRITPCVHKKYVYLHHDYKKELQLR